MIDEWGAGSKAAIGSTKTLGIAILSYTRASLRMTTRENNGVGGIGWVVPIETDLGEEGKLHF